MVEVDKVLGAAYEYFISRLDNPIHNPSLIQGEGSRGFKVSFPFDAKLDGGRIKREAGRALNYLASRVGQDAVDFKVLLSGSSHDVSMTVDLGKAQKRLEVVALVSKVLDDSGICGPMRVPYRDYAQEVRRLSRSFSSTHLAMQVDALRQKPIYAKLDQAILDKIKEIVLQAR